MRRLVAGLAVGMFALAGCAEKADNAGSGSTTTGGDASTTTQKVLTLEEWVELADEICAGLEEEGAEVEAALEAAESAEEAGEPIEELFALYREQVERIAELGTPDESEDLIEEANEVMADQMEMVDELEEEADGDLEALAEAFIADIDDFDEGTARLDEIGLEIGMEDCLSDDARDGESDDSTDDTTDDTTDTTEEQPSDDDAELPAELMDQFGDMEGFREYVVDQMETSGIPRDAARCVVDAMLDNYTVTEIIEFTEGNAPEGFEADLQAIAIEECADLMVGAG